MIMKNIRRIAHFIVRVLMKVYVENVAAPWLEARFFTAWEEYQKGTVYRERLTQVGFQFAFNTFFYDGWEQKYHLKNSLAKNPGLKWKIRLLPFTVPMPDMLEIAANSGFFKSLWKN